ncbi:MAG: hypothetical protein IPH88_04195 [Bacteroidales bacterium]|nr:hypothetical protein [Bacteroidales bacterium]
MKKILTTLLFTTIISLSLFSQPALESGKKVKSNQPSTEYDRIALSYLLLDDHQLNFGDLMKQVFATSAVNDKFDDNSTNRRIVQSPVSREEINNTFLLGPTMPNDVTRKIESELVKNHFTNDVVAKWFSRKSDGSFGVELLQQRGLYNATDAEVKAAGASKIGMAKLMDAGETLLNKSYILIFDFSDLISKDEDYNRQQVNSKTEIKHVKNGFVGTVSVYLFKLDFNENIRNSFWQDLWVESGDPNLAAKKQAFDNFEFPLTYVYRTSTRVESSQFNPGEMLAPKVQATQSELLAKLITEGANQALFSIEKTLEEFRVKTVIFDTHPLQAKIGKKEGLKTDQRFFVYEMEQDASGKIVAKRKGVIRSTKHITDNRQMASGESKPSKFYQVAGSRLDQGMLIQQRNDLGLALSLGIATGGIGGFDGRLDINVSKLLGGKMPSMIKLYVEGGYDPQSFDFVGSSSTITYENFLRYGIGLGKEYCFAHYFKFQPYAGFGLEQITNKDDAAQVLSTIYGHPGVIFGVNLKHNIQFTWQWGIYMMNGSITDQENTVQPIYGSEIWSEGWTRGGATNTFGLRLEF